MHFMEYVNRNSFLTAITICLYCHCLSAVGPSVAGIGYNRDVRPILSATCFHCHGPDKEGRKGDLRLDVSQLAFAERDKGRFAIVPGDLKQSDAWRRIMSDDPDTRMPHRIVNCR